MTDANSCVNDCCRIAKFFLEEYSLIPYCKDYVIFVDNCLKQYVWLQVERQFVNSKYLYYLYDI